MNANSKTKFDQRTGKNPKMSWAPQIYGGHHQTRARANSATLLPGLQQTSRRRSMEDHDSRLNEPELLRLFAAAEGPPATSAEATESQSQPKQPHVEQPHVEQPWQPLWANGSAPAPAPAPPAPIYSAPLAPSASLPAPAPAPHPHAGQPGFPIMMPLTATALREKLAPTANCNLSHWTLSHAMWTSITLQQTYPQLGHANIFMAVAYIGHNQLVEQLLVRAIRYGVGHDLLKAKDPRGWTVYHYAASQGKGAVTQTLCDSRFVSLSMQKVMLQMSNIQGQSPVQVAMLSGRSGQANRIRAQLGAIQRAVDAATGSGSSGAATAGSSSQQGILVGGGDAPAAAAGKKRERAPDPPPRADDDLDSDDDEVQFVSGSRMTSDEIADKKFREAEARGEVIELSDGEDN